MLASSGCGASTSRATEIVRWSPFDSAGKVKATLEVKTVAGGCADIGYTYVGGIAYRCASRNVLFDACWRDGPNPTDYALCIDHPWQKAAWRVHSPHLLLWPGVTFTQASDYPWGMVLNDGNRCGIVQGAHDYLIAHKKRYIVDYVCDRDNLVLLGEGLHLGRIWHANAARYNKTTGYVFLGEQPVRRVYFGTLPPPMARQNQLAHQAYLSAKKIIHQTKPRARLVADLAWVRLALPEADWAYVMFISTDALFQGWSAVVHRANGQWQDAVAYRPYCKKIAAHVRRQLFASKQTRNPLPEMAPTPYGEIRC
jgi:hypothetical protein